MPDAGGDTYAISAEAPRPALPGKVIVRESVDELLDALAADLFIHAHNCVRAFEGFHLASGGATPMPLYRRLMYDPNYRALPWARMHLWIVDERRVPMDDDRSNYAHIREIIVDHSGMPRSHAHPIEAMRDDADVAYEQELVSTLAARGQGRDRLDFVLLGMGDDAHTASLFPRSPAVRERRRLVRINAGPTVTPPERVTMTFPIINSARFIAALVTGEGKRDAIERVVKAYERGRRSDGDVDVGMDVVEELPILGVRPIGGELRWYLDRGACPG